MRLLLAACASLALAFPAVAQDRVPIVRDSAGRPIQGTGVMQVNPQGFWTGPDAAPLAAQRARDVSALQVATGPGFLIDMQLTTDLVDGYVWFIDAASIPADGTIPLNQVMACIDIAAQMTLGSSRFVPEPFTNGMVIALSTTGCATLTKTSAKFIRARARQ